MFGITVALIVTIGTFEETVKKVIVMIQKQY